MDEQYNPIVRTFCELRSALVNAGKIDRRDVRPGTPLEELLPLENRRRVWRRLRRRGLRIPALDIPARDFERNAWSVFHVAVELALWLQQWAAVVLVLPLAAVAYVASRNKAVEFPLGMRTVGELVIYLTRFRDHKDSGYRFSGDEIAIKVRMIVAESLGLSLDDVQMESPLVELTEC